MLNRIRSAVCGEFVGMNKVISDRDIQEFYKTLELPLNASKVEVKEAYRSLARKYHPDRVTGDPTKLKASEEHCKRLNAAYDFLKTYDPPATKTESFAPGSAPRVRVEFKTSPTPTHRTPATLVQEARCFQVAGHLQDAIMSLDTAIALEDDYYPAYELRSEVRLKMGNAYGAKMDLRRAKHFRWVYKSEGRLIDPPIDPPTKSQGSSTARSAARNAVKTAVDAVFKPPNRSASFPSPSKPPYSSPSPKKSAPDASPPKASISAPACPQPKRLKVFSGHVDSISRVLFVNELLISASQDGSVRIWNSQTGELQGCLMVGASVTAIAASPDSNLLITGDRNGKVKMWHLAQRKLLRSIPLHMGKVTGIQFISNGQGFYTAGEDGVLKVFQLNPASLRHTLQISTVPIFSSATLDDRIFTTSADSKLNVIHQGKVLKTSDLSSPICKAMAINSQSKWVAIGDDGGSVHCFDFQGELLKSFAAFPQGEIRSINFMRYGDRLIVTGESAVVKVWEMSGAIITEWNSGTNHVTAVAVSDGGIIAIANENTLQTWDLIA